MKERLLFLGPPGAGKGTQAELICSQFELLHLSTGDLLRAEVAAQTLLGQEAAELMNKGELVGDDLVLAIVENKLKSQAGGWLLDGFPRNVNQAEALTPMLEDLMQPIEAVLLLEVSDSVLIERLLSRGREDDNEDVIRHRLEVYRNQTAPLIDHYRKKDLLVSVEAHGTIPDISKRIMSALV